MSHLASSREGSRRPPIKLMPASVLLSSRARHSQLTPVAGFPRPKAIQRFLKRAMDIAGATLLLLLTAPLIVVCALLVRLQDGGPAIHRRRVIGKDRLFNAFKLRTMRPDADEVLSRDPLLRKRFEVNFKLKDDPRVTRIGGFLRRTSLDELPQLWNVLCGDMSLVGPRMISPPELARYGGAAWIFQLMKPGLTGYWQVEGWHAGSYQDRVAMDQWYVAHWSFLTDFKILCKTPLRVLRRSASH